MKMTAETVDRSMTVYLKGELDHHASRGLMTQLEQQLEASLPLELTMDFGGVTFMDSSGIAVVIRMRQRMRALGGTLRLQHVGAQAGKVFDAANIARFVEIR